MNQDELQARINRLFEPKATPAQDALSRLESIADQLDSNNPLGDLDVDSPSLADMAADIRQCVDAIKLAML